MHYPTTLQWHLTHACNWRCKHCYHDTYQNKNILSFEEAKNFYQSFLALCKPGSRPSVTLTGGEPFSYEHLFPLLEYMHSTSYNNVQPEIALLTNGSFLTKKILDHITTKLPLIKGIQISIEGEEELNDSIRGEKTFESILNTLELLNSYPQIHKHLSLTLSKNNMEEVSKLLPLLVSYGVSLKIMRNVPLGINKEHVEKILPSPQEMQDFYKHIEKLNTKYKLPNGKTAIRTDWCIHGIDEHKPVYYKKRCIVLDKKFLTLMPNGDVYPCRLLPIKLGNIRENSLKEIYNSPLYEQFLDPQKQDSACQSCQHFSRCQAGALCMSNAVYKDPFKKDPQCWR